MGIQANREWTREVTVSRRELRAPEGTQEASRWLALACMSRPGRPLQVLSSELMKAHPKVSCLQASKNLVLLRALPQPSGNKWGVHPAEWLG